MCFSAHMNVNVRTCIMKDIMSTCTGKKSVSLKEKVTLLFSIYILIYRYLFLW